MKLNSGPSNTATMGGVSSVSEFSIRNSSKAFSILSSGLYANKIRAIVRELSTNALDSHIEAGTRDTQFEVHLPNTLEPWFSVRDFGTGLTHDQVLNIYTTYFESTKTESNEYVGALGLGSKSPFSYTDNFSVTAVRDGVKNVYSAYINDAGVPSVAHMSGGTTDEKAGVEVRMAVDSESDFRKFRQEAEFVFGYFRESDRPKILGQRATIDERKYLTEEIIPGVRVQDTYASGSIAVMGNIAYTINVPNATDNLGNLASLLDDKLEIHFALGEIEFQPSREGLSYTDYTIRAIKRKLIKISSALEQEIRTEVAAINNPWEKLDWCKKKHGTSRIYRTPVERYVAKEKYFGFPESNHTYGNLVGEFKVYQNELAKLNISMRGFTMTHGRMKKTCANLNMIRVHDANGDPRQGFQFSPLRGMRIVINDTNVGCLERAKYHHRENTSPLGYPIFVIDPIDKKKPMKTAALMKMLNNPLDVVNASDLDQKPRKNSGARAVTEDIMRVQGNSKYDLDEYRWEAITPGEIDDTTTYYYLPIKGYVGQGKNDREIDCKHYQMELRRSGIKGINNIKIFGVRKNSWEFAEKAPNWINVEEHVTSVLKSIDTNGEALRVALGREDELARVLRYVKNDIVNFIENKDSDLIKLINIMGDLIHSSDLPTKGFFDDHGVDYTDITSTIATEQERIKKVNDKYALLQMLSISGYRTNDVVVQEMAIYINSVDKLRKDAIL